MSDLNFSEIGRRIQGLISTNGAQNADNDAELDAKKKEAETLFDFSSGNKDINADDLYNGMVSLNNTQKSEETAPKAKSKGLSAKESTAKTVNFSNGKTITLNDGEISKTNSDGTVEITSSDKKTVTQYDKNGNIIYEAKYNDSEKPLKEVYYTITAKGGRISKAVKLYEYDQETGKLVKETYNDNLKKESSVSEYNQTTGVKVKETNYYGCGGMQKTLNNVIEYDHKTGKRVKETKYDRALKYAISTDVYDPKTGEKIKEIRYKVGFNRNTTIYDCKNEIRYTVSADGSLVSKCDKNFVIIKDDKDNVIAFYSGETIEIKDGETFKKNKDGSIEVTSADKKVITQYDKDGIKNSEINTKTVNSGKISKVDTEKFFDAQGNVTKEVATAYDKAGEVSYVIENNSSSDSYPLVMPHGPLGVKIQFNADGAKLVLEKGQNAVINSDGTVEVTNADGSITKYDKDGNEIKKPAVTFSNGKTLELQEGETVETDFDNYGSIMITSADGNLKTVYNKKGLITSTTLVENFDNGEKKVTRNDYIVNNRLGTTKPGTVTEIQYTKEGYASRVTNNYGTSSTVWEYSDFDESGNAGKTVLSLLNAESETICKVENNNSNGGYPGIILNGNLAAVKFSSETNTKLVIENGQSAVIKEDGIVEVTNADGSVTKYDKDGNEIKKPVVTFSNEKTLELEEGETCKTNDDGSVEVTSADGKTVTKYNKDGILNSTKETKIAEDGTKTVTYTTNPNKGTTWLKTVTTTKNNKTTDYIYTVFDKDGNKITERVKSDYENGKAGLDVLKGYANDGSVNYEVKDSFVGDGSPSVTNWNRTSATITFGDKKVTIKTGDKAEIDKDGNVLVTKQDGTIKEYDKEGNVINNEVVTFSNDKHLIIAEGETYKTNSDGSVEVTSADGKTITKYSEAGVLKSINTTETSDDGLKTQTNTEYNKNGVISKKTETVSKDDKNVKRTELGYNADGKLSREIIWTDFIVNNVYQHHVDIKYDVETGEIDWIVEADGQATSAYTVSTSNKDGSGSIISISYPLGGDDAATLTPQKGQHIVLYGYRYDGSVKNGWNVFKYGAYHSTTKLEKHLYTFENGKKLYVAEYETLTTNDDGTLEVKDKNNIVTKYDNDGNVVSVKNADFVETQPIDETIPADKIDKPDGTQVADTSETFENIETPDVQEGQTTGDDTGVEESQNPSVHSDPNTPVVYVSPTPSAELVTDESPVVTTGDITKIWELIGSENWDKIKELFEQNIDEKYRTLTYIKLSEEKQQALKAEIDALVAQGKWEGNLPLWYSDTPIAIRVPAYTNTQGIVIPEQKITQSFSSDGYLCISSTVQNSDGTSTEQSVQLNNNGNVENVGTYNFSQNGDLLTSNTSWYSSNGKTSHNKRTYIDSSDGSMWEVETYTDEHSTSTTTTHYSQEVDSTHKILSGYEGVDNVGGIKTDTRYVGHRENRHEVPVKTRNRLESVTVTEYKDEKTAFPLDYSSYINDMSFATKVKTEVTTQKYSHKEGGDWLTSSETVYKNFSDQVIRTTSEKYELREEEIVHKDRYYEDEHGIKHPYKEIKQENIQTYGDETTNLYACLITSDGDVPSNNGVKSEKVYVFDEDGYRTGEYTDTLTAIESGESLGKTKYVRNEDGGLTPELLDTSDCNGKIGTYYSGSYWRTATSSSISTVLSAAKMLCDMGYDLEKEGIISWEPNGDAIVRLYELEQSTFMNGITAPSDTRREIKIEAKDLLHNEYYDRYAVLGDRTAIAIGKAMIQTCKTDALVGWDTTISDAVAVLTGNLELENKCLVRDAITSHTNWDDIKFLTLDSSTIQCYSADDEYDEFGPLPLSMWGGFEWDISSPVIDTESNPVDFGITETFLVRGHNGDAISIKDINGRDILIYQNGFYETFAVQGYNAEKNTVTIVNPTNNIPFEIDAEIADRFFIATMVKEPSESYVPQNTTALGENVEYTNSIHEYSGMSIMEDEVGMKNAQKVIQDIDWDNLVIEKLEGDLSNGPIEKDLGNGQKIINGLTNYGNYYEIMTQDSVSGIWTGMRKWYNGETFFQAEIRHYDANGVTLYKDFYKNINDVNHAVYGRTEFYPDGTIKAEDYYANWIWNPQKGISVLLNKHFIKDYYENSNIKRQYSEFDNAAINDNGNPYYNGEKIIQINNYRNDGSKIDEYREKINPREQVLNYTSTEYNSEGNKTKETEVEYASTVVLNSENGYTMDIPEKDKGLKYERIYDEDGGYVQTTTYMNEEFINKMKFDKDGNWVENIIKNSLTNDDMDGNFGYCDQNGVGSCHLLATLKALCDNGLDLKETGIIKWNDDGSATVRFYVKEGLWITKNLRYVEKNFTISAQELATNQYVNSEGETVVGATGDRTGIALERAFVKLKQYLEGAGDISDTAATGLSNSDNIIGGNTWQDLCYLFGAEKAREFNCRSYQNLWENNEVDFNNVKVLSFNLDGDNKNDFPLMDKYLKKVGNDYYIQDIKTGEWVQLFTPHAYYVEYNAEDETVKFTNPHNLISFTTDVYTVANCFYFQNFDIPEEYLKKSA